MRSVESVIEAERRLVEVNRERIDRMETIFAATLARIWGDAIRQRQRRVSSQPRASPWEKVRKKDRGLKARPNLREIYRAVKIR